MLAHRLVAELNSPSDGNGITGIPSAVFNEMRNKKKKREIKRRKNLRKLSQFHAFSFFKCKFAKFLITAKSMYLRIKVAKFNTFRLEKCCVHMVLFRFMGQSWKAVTRTDCRLIKL